ncbi:cupin domain-containing protein [Leptolyngbya sp. FACHB-261]|uniref:cupin domain-containing protein n=1 Tax=Leptolyngbya sp. FACHB-261 TaxID=2692806 RepID=UPI001689FD84|nr:cupin domain-containing protein [Leptolyngbya sp. FACHB-261]MBD2104566.1 cupin domain-containing protein [Leptolyngbya sp. FACHB-261]
MVTTRSPHSAITAQLYERIDYTKPKVTRIPLVKTEGSQFALICVTAGTELAEHATTRDVSITVIEGQGTLTLEGREVTLEPGVFVFMPANTPHALQASTNLAFLHT